MSTVLANKICLNQTTSSQKTSCRTLVCPTASFLATGGFKSFQMHAWSTSMLLLLHSMLMLSVVKVLVGGCAINSHGNYIVDHGKSWKNHGIVIFNFCGNPGLAHMPTCTVCWTPA